jgi:aminopeptidase N
MSSTIDSLPPAVGGRLDMLYTPRRTAFERRRGPAGALAFLMACAAPGAGGAIAGPPAGPSIVPDPLRYVSPSRPYRVLHTALDLDVDLERRSIAGSVTHTVHSLRDDLAELSMNCVELTVDSVRVDGARADFDYPVSAGLSTSWLASAGEALADDQIVIRLPRPLARGAAATVTVYYRGAPKIGLYWIQPEKGIPDKRYEVWSQGEGEDNRYWIPCNDYPNDKSTFEGRFRVPKGYTAISNGALVATRDVGGRSEFHWKLDQPQVSYLIMLAVAKYRIYEQKWRDIPITYVVPPDADDATILRGYGLTPDMMEFFERTIGIDYPYAKYAQVVVQDYIYGGMENTTATVMNMRTLYDERTELTRREHNLVAHELAHQWWGDMLTCREWSHMWLNEGFATYYAYLYKEHREGDDAFRYQMRSAHLDVVKGDDADPRPMVVDFFNRADARNNAHVYVKGASVLHMLRFMLGDGLYHETIRHYGEAHRFDVVETQDLMRAVKDVTGENLDWFFEQWAFLAGHPKFKVTKSWDRTARVLRLKVEQTQKAGGLVPVFRVPLDIEIAWDGGTSLHRVLIEQATQDFYFQAPSEPRMVIFDKGDWVLKTLEFPKRVDELLYELEHADYMARIQTVEALGAKGSDERTVPALRGVLMAEGHYGLRREAALALGKVGTAPALDALIGGLAISDAMVRLAAVEALGNFYGDETAAARLESVVESDRAYGVRGEAVSSLVKIRAERAARVCTRALAQEVIAAWCATPPSTGWRTSRPRARCPASGPTSDPATAATIATSRSRVTPGSRKSSRKTATGAVPPRCSPPASMTGICARAKRPSMRWPRSRTRRR